MAGNANYIGTDSGCEPFTVDKAQLVMESKVHNSAHVDKTNGNVPLGSVMHDTAKITGGLVGGFSPEAITFQFYLNGTCAPTGSAVANTGADEDDATRDRSAASAALAAGAHSYQAFVAGNANYIGTDSGCEPFEVEKADTSTVTEIHDTGHSVVTLVALGTTVHDQATVLGQVGGFVIGGDVTFTFYNNGTCSETGTGAGTVGVVAGIAHPSNAQTPLVVGSYSFQATYNGDSNYNESTSDCEPLDVRIPTRRTQGFWATHYEFTKTIWMAIPAADRILCGTRDLSQDGILESTPFGSVPQSIRRMEGGFWSSISKKTTGLSRSPLDQARMQLIQQLFGAMLNVQAFGADPGTLIADAKAAYCGTNRVQILAMKDALAAFNESGEGVPLPPGVVPGSADPKKAQGVANKPFWNTLP